MSQNVSVRRPTPGCREADKTAPEHPFATLSRRSLERLLIETNRPLTDYRVSQILRDQATAVGIGRVIGDR